MLYEVRVIGCGAPSKAQMGSFFALHPDHLEAALFLRLTLAERPEI